MKARRRTLTHCCEPQSLLRTYAEFAGAATSRRRSEQRLNAARIEAELANRAKSEFIANMSHDLRTPLNAIIGFSEVMSITDLVLKNAAKAKEYAVDISHAGRHLLGIINDILDLAKLESGEPVVDLEACDVNDILQTASLFVRPLAEAKSQKFSIATLDELPLLVIDALRTKQIIINLLSNAVKFSPVGGAICATAQWGSHGCIVLTVSDNGPGMTETELDHALTRFGRVKNALTRGQEGTGLGLTIVKMLSEAQGGQFSISSAPGVGTSAKVTFPSSSVAKLKV
jgi:two-component system cell cycle sensor histidine kinase PleC